MLSRMSLRLPHRTLTKTYNISEIVASHRSLHITSRFRDSKIRNSNLFDIAKQKPLIATAFVRFASTEDEKVAENLLHSIPDPPTPPPPAPEPAPEILDIIQSFDSEPALSTLGLAGNSPSGLVQQALEWLHVTHDLPWWATIVIGVVCARILMFPLVIKSQRNSARMNNHLPQMQLLQLKMTEARQCGNDYEAARLGQELLAFMKEKGVHPLKNMLVPLAQAPIFLSFFWGLRGMAEAPVQSMMHGGLWWFADLTVPDQYYLLPLITSTTMWLTIKLGVDGMQAGTAGVGMFKYALKALPVVLFPFIMHFDGAILVYWTTTNFISLAQVGFLRLPGVREYFKIEALVKHDISKMPIPQKGFVKGFKESLSNMKKAREMADRGFADHLQFERAGKGPLPKTYKYDPTRQSSASTVLAKKRG